MMDPRPALSFDARLVQGQFRLDARFEAGARITALFGPSGAGKTTILNLIAGIVSPDEGRIALSGTPLVDTGLGIAVPPYRRRIGYVFQDAQLFPHLTVKQNLLFGRWFAGAGQLQIAFDKVADTLDIRSLLTKRPTHLSGGEKQRVALARAILSDPALLLLDEPLASLDDRRRMDILPLIEHVRDDFHVPILYVSHSKSEVERLADRIVLIEGGRVSG